MAAVLVRLKLALLRATFSRDTAAVFGVVIGAFVAGIATLAAVLTLVGLHSSVPADAAGIAIPSFTTLTLMWILAPLIFFGSDATLDPARFASLPLSAKSLRPGLLAAAFIGIPGVCTLLLAFAQVLTWSRSPLALLAALLGGCMGAATCVLSSRVITSAFSSALGSRKMRDVAAVFMGLIAAGAGLTNQAVTHLAQTDTSGSSSALHKAADILGWAPLGWAWSLPADVARGHAAFAGLKFFLAALLLALLWLAWGHSLDRALTSPLSTVDGGEVSSSSFLARHAGSTPTTAIMGRCLRYWRRDPRYVSAYVGFLVAPLILCVTWASKGDAVFLAPVFFVVMAAPTLMSDLAYDNSAFWLHVSTGVSMRADRWGRLLALEVVTLPVALAALGAIAIFTGKSGPVIWALALIVTLAGTGGGIALAAGAIEPGQAPAPGQSGFGRSSGSGFRIVLAMFGSWLASAACAAPIIALIVCGFPWLALAFAPIVGGLVLVGGVRFSARRLDAKLPEMLVRVSR